MEIAAGTVHIAEAGAGAPIVLLHGNPDTHTVWSGVVTELMQGFRCIAPDMPGYGESSAPRDEDLPLDRQGQWVAAVLDALKLDRVHLVCHDVGGAYGLSFSTQFPDRLRTLTIMNASFSADYRWHFWARVWRTRGLGEIAMKIANGPLFRRELERGSPKMPRAYADHAWKAYTPETRKNVLRWYRHMDPTRYGDWEQRMLGAIAKVPHQVLWGDRDPFILPTFADRFGGTVHRFADLGHWSMVEDPARVAAPIRELCSAHA